MCIQQRSSSLISEFHRLRQRLILGLLMCFLVSGTSAHAAMVAVQKVRFQEVNATTRLVLELNGTPKALAVKDRQGQPMTVSFPGGAGACKLPLNQRFTWPNLSGVYVEHRQGRVTVFIKRNLTGTVRVAKEPQRVVIAIPHTGKTAKTSVPVTSVAAAGVPQPAMNESSGNNTEDLSEGVRYARFMQRNANGPVQISVLEIDPHYPGLEILPALASNRMGAKSNVGNIVASHQAVAGINGSFFKQDVGIPLGMMMINQELISGPIYDRVALGINANNDLVMARIRLAGELSLPDGQKVPLHNINQPRISPESTVVYSSRWGAVAPAVPKQGFQVQIRNSRVTMVSTTTPLPIPRDGVVISGPGTPSLARLEALSPNQNVQLNLYTFPDWSGMKHAIGGGPWLVHAGQPYVDIHAQHFTARSLGFREPRTAVGITASGKMLLVTVDGRRKNVSVGMTLGELAILMQQLGAINAMNLDGGSSTQMSIYGKIVNRPSSGNVGVSNSLIIRKTGAERVAVKSL